MRARFLSSSFPLFVQGRRRRAPFGPFQSIPKLSLATTASNTVNKISFWPVQYVSSNHESSPWVALGNEEFSERQNWEDSAKAPQKISPNGANHHNLVQQTATEKPEVSPPQPPTLPRRPISPPCPPTPPGSCATESSGPARATSYLCTQGQAAPNL